MAGVPAFMRSLVPRVYVPKGDSVERLRAVNDLLLAHSLAGNGEFQVREGRSGRLHIVPLTARDRSEEVVQQTPVLDRQISFEPRQYSGLEFLQALVDAVARATGVPMEIGTTPINTFAHYTGAFAASNEAARSVLARFLDGVGAGYSWQLFFDRTPSWHRGNSSTKSADGSRANR
jgi:hypothetical protein